LAAYDACDKNFRNPAQMHSLGELLDSTLVINEIRRIANETVKRAETREETKSVPAKSRRPYPTATDYSAVSIVREKISKKYGS
jgi:hypothetical protein